MRSVIDTFSSGGLDAVLTIRRSVNSDNANRKVDGRAESRIIQLACGPAPEGYGRWTLRLFADKSKVVLDEPVGKDAIARVLKKRNQASQKPILVHPVERRPRIHSLHGGCARCYVRNGTCSIFAMIEPLGGWHLASLYPKLG